ncbi:MAG: LysM peptidoglycan-binding domain-containing protein [Bacteroidales bacterium]
MFPARILPAFMLFVAMMFYPVVLPAQVPVEVSSQKIVVEGKVYYMHQVKKGQTLYSISKAYNITVEQLAGANMIPPNGIYEGQMLKVPGSAGGQRTTAGVQPATAGAQTAKPGATTRARQDERYIYHRVTRGETLASIAGEYGISVRDLKKANKHLLFPNEGDYLMIPRKKTSASSPVKKQEPVADTVRVPAEEADTIAAARQNEIFTVLAERSVLKELRGSVKVAVMLPFFINENTSRSHIDSTGRDSQGKKIYKEVSMSGNWIYEGSLPFLEAYEGILIAADSLRSLGLKVELDVYDISSDTMKINRLVWSGILNDVDLIIGPVFSSDLNHMAAFAAERNIPIVSPVSLRDQNILENRPTLYRVFPSEKVAQDVMVKELESHQGSNVIFLYSDTLMNDPQTSLFWHKVRRAMLPDSLSDTTLVTAQYFTGMIKKRDTYSGVEAFEGLLKPGRENIVVLAFTQTPAVSSAFSTLNTLSRKYDIKVLGFPEIGGQETIDLKYYYDLELFIPTETYIDFNAPKSTSFTVAFRKKFRTEPMAGSFAWRGFDIAYYFIGGIASHGDEFLRDPGIFSPDLLCLEPDFRRERPNDGYENRGLFILHYKKDMTIEVKKPWTGYDALLSNRTQRED